MNQFNDLQDKVKKLLGGIEKGESPHSDLREVLKDAAKHRFVAMQAKQFNLTRRQDKTDLVALAKGFVGSPMITKTTLRERGWTDTLIGKYLPVPDVQTKNPHYKTAAPMCLYVLTRVESVESQDAVKLALQKIQDQRRARSKGALAACEKKRQSLLEWVGMLQVSVPAFEIGELVRDAVTHYNWLWQSRDHRGDSSKSASTSDCPDFLERITVNYLRHDCTDYEQRLGSLAGKTGCGEAYEALKSKINCKIYQEYPDLAGQIASWQFNRAKLKAIAVQEAKELSDAKLQMNRAYYANNPLAVIDSLLPQLKQLVMQSQSVKPKAIKAFKKGFPRFVLKMQERLLWSGINSAEFATEAKDVRLLLNQLEALKVQG